MTRRRPALDRPTRRVDARVLATAQREISVAEFFVKNRHLLGLDTPARALLTVVKEAVDNALDACEDAGILPEVRVEIEPCGADAVRVAVEDNGPGIVEAQIGKVFGKLLYGSKFHALRQARGQQGMGISAAGMYGQLTTGQPMRIVSRTGAGRPAWELKLSIDTTKNRPEIHRRKRADWTVTHGTRVEIELVGLYQRGRHSVDEFLRQTAIANPHATIRFEDPEGLKTVHARTVRRRPPRPRAILPHPHGVELGALVAMLQRTGRRTLAGFLQHEMSRVGPRTAAAILEHAGAPLRAGTHPRAITRAQARSLHAAIAATKIGAPSTDCVVPIGETAVRRSLEQQIAAELVVTVTRPPAVYRGHPFVVEAGLAWGHREGSEEGEPGARVIRLANRVPLLFEPGACAMTRAVAETHWQAYGVPHVRGSLPTGPLVIVLHLASVWVPFTSESKEAIAGYPEIEHELRLALQACGRRLARWLAHRRHDREASRRRAQIERFVPHIGEALQEILGLSEPRRRALVDHLGAVLHRGDDEEAA